MFAQVVRSVVNQTGGSTFTPMGVSSAIQAQLYAFGGVFSGVTLESSQAVHYIDVLGNLRETVIPVAGLRDAVLDPDMTAPGAETRPAKIVGAVHQPYRGTMWVVAVFKPNAASCPDCEPPEKVRFYYTATDYHEYSIVWGTFFDAKGDHKLEPVDEGAVISHKRSCISVGLEQVCWEPDSYSDVRDEPTPKDIAYDAYTRFKDRYDLRVDFYVDDAVPDILGLQQRSNCANYLANATTFTGMAACYPNVVITSAKETKPNQPIAILIVAAAADIRTFDTAGNFIGQLPVGEYLVMNAENASSIPGTPTALFLVNGDGTNHYLIPSMTTQGFGYNSSYDARVAGIRDGFAHYRCLGW